MIINRYEYEKIDKDYLITIQLYHHFTTIL